MRWTKKTVEFLLSQMGFSYQIERIEVQKGKRAWIMTVERLINRSGKFEPLRIKAFGVSAKDLFEDFLEKLMEVQK